MKKLFASLLLVVGSLVAYANPVAIQAADRPSGLIVQDVDPAVVAALAENDNVQLAAETLVAEVVEAANATQNGDEALFAKFQNAGKIAGYAGFLRMQVDMDILIGDVDDALPKLKKSTKLLKLALVEFQAVLDELKKEKKNDA